MEEKDKGFRILKKRRNVLENIQKFTDQIIKDTQIDRDQNKSVSRKLRNKIKDSLLCEEVDNLDLWNKFYFGGNLVDVEITSFSMKTFLEENRKELEYLVDEHIIKIDNYESKI